MTPHQGVLSLLSQPTPKGERAAARLVVRGVVQGVGFRPFVYRLAHDCALGGWVVNSSKGVVIVAEGPSDRLSDFVRMVRSEAPPLARIDSVELESIAPEGVSQFKIERSEEDSEETTLICPDVAVCPDCLREFLDASDRRHRYPFINCTNCGPRFSIINETPYDRPRTSMRTFEMCPLCLREYEDPLDRRFHAQPNACQSCGPRLRLLLPADPERFCAEIVTGRSYLRAPDEISAAVAEDPARAARWLIKRGAIIGVRGLGGFHVACNARFDEAVLALREKKRRPAKPLAVMCASLGVARGLADVGRCEAETLSSPMSPIVLLRKRTDPIESISPHVAPNNNYLGVMLPYAPVHHLLFDDELDVLVMTSANAPDEPIIADVATAQEKLGRITRTFLDHNREIVNRSDDSVEFVERDIAMISRRSRGYAPYPIDLCIDSGEVLACGTELKNTFTFLSGGRAFTSQHIGDLANQATLEFYEEMIDNFRRWFRLDPRVIAHDLHPDYLATRYAKSLAEDRSSEHALVGVQHHHAHIASAMIENEVTEPVIGIALDGTGYGTDGKIWGCEFLIADLIGFERAGHLRYVPLPGGDAAIKRPYRVALSHLLSTGDARAVDRGLSLMSGIDAKELDLVVQQTEKRINCVDTSSAGRLFDAVSALLGICYEISYEAQAAIELESAVDPSVGRSYDFGIASDDEGFIVDPSGILVGIVEDATGGIAVNEIAAAFHNTVVKFCVAGCRAASSERDLSVVALSGGVFQNRFLLKGLASALESEGYRVLLHSKVPTNDGGVSLGQAVVASETARARRSG